MGYGAMEYRYAEPFALALEQSPQFSRWVLSKTKFSDLAASAYLLHEEMKAYRSKTSKTWWRSHYTEACRCKGCSGQETDLLAIFETPTKFRFAMHFEVKHPGDRFGKKGEQAINYAIRAACWVKSPPARILPHDASTCALLMSDASTDRFRPHLSQFDALYTFEELAARFPPMYADT